MHFPHFIHPLSIIFSPMCHLAILLPPPPKHKNIHPCFRMFFCCCYLWDHYLCRFKEIWYSCDFIWFLFEFSANLNTRIRIRNDTYSRQNVPLFEITWVSVLARCSSKSTTCMNEMFSSTSSVQGIRSAVLTIRSVLTKTNWNYPFQGNKSIQLVISSIFGLEFRNIINN